VQNITDALQIISPQKKKRRQAMVENLLIRKALKQVLPTFPGKMFKSPEQINNHFIVSHCYLKF
jgi:DNA polymerase II small subunit/DNA polymerase delta subunit B